MKLYTLVRRDLPKSQQAVQSCHAVAELLLRVGAQGWDNGTMVLIGVPGEPALKQWHEKLTGLSHKCGVFREPDIGDQITAISFVGVPAGLEREVSTLPLL